MIRFSLKVPVTIQSSFWLIAGFIGFMNGRGDHLSLSDLIINVLMWVVVITVSVLFHELGHAYTALFFGRQTRIELAFMGGLTQHTGQKLSKFKEFLIVLNGPLFGFLLFGIAAVVSDWIAPVGLSRNLINAFIWVNFFWTIVNLFPIVPLDGGQLLRILLEGVFGIKGMRYSLFTSSLIAFFIAIIFFYGSQFFIGALLFLLAYQSFDAWRKTRDLRAVDEEESLRKVLIQAEEMIALGDLEGAIKLLEELREIAKEGLLYNVATQHLAYLYYKIEKPKEAYILLKPMRKNLTDEALVVLHNSASILGDYPLVADLSGIVFQAAPSVDNAIRNAVASASMKQVDATIGWLRTAQETGCETLSSILNSESFDSVKEDPSFQEFIKRL